MVSENLVEIVLNRTASRVKFHSEIFDNELPSYGASFLAGSDRNLKGKLLVEEGSVFLPYGEVDATPENIRKYTHPYIVKRAQHQCLRDLFTGSQSNLARPLQNQIREYGIDLDQNELAILVNLHQPVKWSIEKYQITPVVENVGRFFKKKIITGDQKTQVGTEIKQAYSNEIMDTETREPVYVNEVAIFLPVTGRIQGAHISRPLFFELYTPENVEEMIKNTRDIQKKDLLLAVLERSFPDIYTKSQERLSRLNTTLGQLPTFLYNPSNKQFQQIK